MSQFSNLWRQRSNIKQLLQLQDLQVRTVPDGGWHIQEVFRIIKMESFQILKLFEGFRQRVNSTILEFQVGKVVHLAYIQRKIVLSKMA